MSREPAFATMALDRISEANRAMTVPLPLGRMHPMMNATFPAVRDDALDAAGMSYAAA